MTVSPLQLVVGLGNPGPQYAETRHNAGFWLVDRLAARYGGLFRSENRFKGDLSRVTIAGQALWLFKPTTFMNRSGQSIVPLMAFYKIAPEAVLVVHDDLDLPPGTVRLKRGGGHGGHNGLRDTIRLLGNGNFARLRVGIGHPGNSAEVVGYVLRRAPADEQRLIETAIDDALREFPSIVGGDWSRAMQALHSRRPVTDTPD